MSTAVYENHPMPVPFNLDGAGGRASSATAATAVPLGIEAWLAEQAAAAAGATEKKDEQFNFWASIQPAASAVAAPPYVHPLMRRSASFLSQKSLEICTESLGSETGSEDTAEFLPWRTGEEEEDKKNETDDEEEEEVEEEDDEEEAYLFHKGEDAESPPARRKELAEVNYHCSTGRKSTGRSFPPPLPSLSRRDGPCLSMRSRRQGGRLVMEAVSVPSQNYLHAQRCDGRLLLSFAETSFRDIYPDREEPAMELRISEAEDEPEEEVAEEEEEEVEVVDRGIVVEVKVSSSPQPQSGFLKVQRSSVVINKFVGVPAALTKIQAAAAAVEKSNTATTTTATAVVAAAAAASSSRSTDERYWRGGVGPDSAQRHPSPEKLFFTSKRVMNRQELLHQMRRCSEHRRPLFIWEPCCAVTS